MADRIGVCAGCESKFKIPPTFSGTKAKCKKCGGVVEIPSLEEAAVPAAEPKKEPARKPKKAADLPSKKKAEKPAGKHKKAIESSQGEEKSASPGKLKTRSAASRASGGRKGGKGKRARAGAKDTSKNKMWIWIGGGGGLIVIVVILILLMSGGDEEAVTPSAEVQTAQDAPQTGAGGDTAVADDHAGKKDNESKIADASEPKPEPEEDPTKEEGLKTVMPEDFASNPVIEFEPLPPMIGCDQARFDELTADFLEVYIKRELPAFKSRTMKKNIDQALEESYDIAPIIINAYNGLNLLDVNQVALAFSISLIWNKYTGMYYFDTNFRGGADESVMRKNLENNYITIQSLVDAWRTKYAEDEDQQQIFMSNVEKARAAQAKREARDKGE
ncbi:MAG: hypothetical protein KJ645_11370 [Planctomycetes bacterium]|nr:hypothetical protein [Planctomycetota bacterium]